MTATQPKRIQRRRTKGWRMPENAVYVGRPTWFGNPFKVGVHGKAGECVAKYRDLLNRFPSVEALKEWQDAGGNSTQWVVLAGRVEWCWDRIVGKDLVCWCPLNRECHADVLLELAAAYESLRRAAGAAPGETSKGNAG